MATRGLVVKVRINPKVKREIEKYKLKTRLRLRQTTNLAAINIESGAKINLTRNKSVISGRLRSSQAHQMVDDDLGANIGTSVFYGPFVELGTSRSRAKPYLTPAFDKEVPMYVKRVRKIMKEERP